MGTSRIIPDSITGRQKALSTAKAKKDGALVPADNILSAATSERLDLGYGNYKAGIAAITLAKANYHHKVELARPERILIKNNITSFYDTLNGLIKRGKAPASVRAYYRLPITNRKMPKMDTDVEILAAADAVLSGDILRVAAGGVVMSSPSIAEYTTVYNLAKPAILAISNAHTVVSNAILELHKQLPEIKDLITHVWDEVEAHDSMSPAANRRVHAREWGVKYRSTGILSVVTGNCKDEDGVALAGIKVRIIGANTSTLSDALGHFSLNTSLYGDLELEATLSSYEQNIIEFTKEDGVAVVVSVVMTKL